MTSEILRGSDDDPASIGAAGTPPYAVAPLAESILVSRDGEGYADYSRSGEAAISANGRWVAFVSEARLTGDELADQEVLLSGPHGGPGAAGLRVIAVAGDGPWPDGEDSDEPSVSGDGSVVVFSSEMQRENELGQPPRSRVFAHRTHTATTSMLSASRAEAEQPRISADGRWVAYCCDGVLVVHDLLTGRVVPVSVRPDDTPARGWNHAVSADGRFIAFVSEDDGIVDGPPAQDMQVYVRDMANRVTVLVSANPTGVPAAGECDWPSVSADGRFVAFDSDAHDLVADPTQNFQVYRRDVVLGVTTVVSHHDSACIRPSMSADGRYVAYQSEGPPGIGRRGYPVSQVVRCDLDTGQTLLVSSSLDGGPGAGESFRPVISADGTVVAFNSTAPFLTAGPGCLGVSQVLRWTASEAAAPYVT